MDRKSYYDKETGLYVDTTTGITYQPLNYCEICGMGSEWVHLDVHHYLDQAKCKRDLKSKVIYPSTWTQEFINEHQKLFTLCRECHDAVHFNKTKEINGKRLKDYFFRSEEKPVTKPKAFIVKRKKNDR